MSLQAEIPVSLGRLDRLVTLLSPVVGRDSAGGVVTTWVNQGNIWAEFVPQSGREVQKAGQLVALALATFRIRYRAITAAWRVMMGPTIWELIAPPIEVGGRQRYYNLVCRALDPTNLSINGIGIQYLNVPLAQGDTSKVVTFLTPFSAIPAAVYVSLIIPGGGFLFEVGERALTRTTAGLTVDIAASVPDVGYSLSIIAIL